MTKVPTTTSTTYTLLGPRCFATRGQKEQCVFSKRSSEARFARFFACFASRLFNNIAIELGSSHFFELNRTEQFLVSSKY